MQSQVTLQEDEKILLNYKPKKSYIPYALLQASSRYLFIFIGLIVITFFQGPSTHAMIHNIASNAHAMASLRMYGLLVLVICIGFIIYQTGKVNGLSYVFTNKRIIVKSTFINFNKKTLNYSNITDVDMASNPVRSFLGVAAVVLQQPGSGRFNKTLIDGITHDQAEQIVELVSQKMTESSKA